MYILLHIYIYVLCCRLAYYLMAVLRRIYKIFFPPFTAYSYSLRCVILYIVSLFLLKSSIFTFTFFLTFQNLILLTFHNNITISDFR
jgi:hypothetical protein